MSFCGSPYNFNYTLCLKCLWSGQPDEMRLTLKLCQVHWECTSLWVNILEHHKLWSTWWQYCTQKLQFLELLLDNNFKLFYQNYRSQERILNLSFPLCRSVTTEPYVYLQRKSPFNFQQNLNRSYYSKWFSTNYLILFVFSSKHPCQSYRWWIQLHKH